jgi:hypothetical protein
MDMAVMGGEKRKEAAAVQCIREDPLAPKGDGDGIILMESFREVHSKW